MKTTLTTHGTTHETTLQVIDLQRKPRLPRMESRVTYSKIFTNRAIGACACNSLHDAIRGMRGVSGIKDLRHFLAWFYPWFSKNMRGFKEI